MSNPRREFWDKLRQIPSAWTKGLAMVLVVGIVALTADSWGPALKDLVAGSAKADEKEEEDGHAAHDDGDTIELTDAARKTMGLRLATVEATSYTRSISVPAMVVHRPGRTRFQISAPMTGIVTDIAVVHGQAVWSDALLFKLRLTHEDLVRVQSNFLQTLEQRDVEIKEIKRLKEFIGKGVPGTVVLEKEYARDKLVAMLKAQREALLLHGLTTEQVKAIETTRKLRHDVTVPVPRLHLDQSLHFDHEPDSHGKTAKKSDGKSKPHKGERHRFVIEQLPVHIGQAVKAGDTLCVLADYGQLFLEGRAFEHDAELLVRESLSKTKGKPRHVTAITRSGTDGEVEKEKLKVVYVDNEIDVESRALHFFAALPNSIVRETKRDGKTFVNWKYRPGQRMQIRVPVETWNNVVVLPADAVARDGAESYVFVENGNTFERRPVVVRYRDQFEVVVEPGDWAVLGLERVAMNGAHQLLVALKIKAGGGGGHHHHH